MKYQRSLVQHPYLVYSLFRSQIVGSAQVSSIAIHYEIRINFEPEVRQALKAVGKPSPMSLLLSIIAY